MPISSDLNLSAQFLHFSTAEPKSLKYCTFQAFQGLFLISDYCKVYCTSRQPCVAQPKSRAVRYVIMIVYYVYHRPFLFSERYDCMTIVTRE